MTDREFLDIHIPHRLAVLRGYLVAWTKQEELRRALPYDGQFAAGYDGHFGDLYRSALDGASITIRSLWAKMGAQADKRQRKPLYKTNPEVPDGVRVISFLQPELDKMPLEVLEVLLAASSSTPHISDPYHNVDGAKMVSVINITFREFERRIPGIPQAEFGRWMELQQ